MIVICDLQKFLNARSIHVIALAQTFIKTYYYRYLKCVSFMNKRLISELEFISGLAINSIIRLELKTLRSSTV